MGLNKDLERALKDKDRYRKKMKDSMAAIGEAGKVEQDETANNDRSSAAPKAGSLGALVTGMRDNDNDHDDSRAPYPETPVDEKPPRTAQETPSRIPETSSYAPNNFHPDTSNNDSIRQPAQAPPIPPSRGLPLRTSEKRQRNAQESSHTPTSSVTDNTQTKIMQSPPRKAPPAPLNLGRQNQASSHLHQAEESAGLDGDYDDDLEVDEIPTFNERGRRKTREEDDRDREIAAMQDAEARSLSKKSKTRPPGDAPPQPQEPLPQMKHAVQISPPQMTFTGPDSTSGSLAGMLNSTSNSNQAGDIQKRTVLAPPPMSPGLPASPRPMPGINQQFQQKNLTLGPQQVALPPMSARMGAFPSMPLSPRAPRQQIPLPPNTPMSMSMQTPSMTKFAPAQLASQAQITEEAESPIEQAKASPSFKTVMEPGEVYHGFMTDEYPEFLLPPNALPSISVRVASSRLKPSRASMMFPNRMDEDPVFTLAVYSRNGDDELWRVEKDSLSLHYLDQDLKRHKAFSDLKTPEKSLFTGHAPAKIDARRIALDKYLDDVLNTPMNTKSAVLICQYLSSNTLEPLVRVQRPHDSANGSPSRTGPDGKPFKHGYLTKRGKNFGGWKARYFILDGPVLRYYEAPPPQGAHLGAIKLQHSKIGKQQQQSTEDNSSDADNQYRHAFLILEPKRKDSNQHVRHVLCAESDEERDEWVEALVQYMEPADSDDEAPHELSQRSDTGGSSRTTGKDARKKLYGSGKHVNESHDDLRALPYGATVPGQAPRHVGRNADSSTPSPSLHGTDKDSQRSRDRENGTPSPTLTGHERDHMPHSESGVSISGPQKAVKIEDGAAWGNKPATANSMEDKKAQQKKRSFFGFGGTKGRPSSESQDQEFSSLSQMSFDQHGPIRAVFGAPLGEAVRYNHPVNVDIELPAVVYRCVEYLESKNAIQEEGIFRLSGSSVVIKALRERFNVEGDVDLITDGQYYDIHAVASLLKLYLRELPTTILTRELHLDFLGVTEVHDEKDKVLALCQLVHKLPKANNTLLRYLSQFLIMVVNNSEINKMTVRNVGIVFSPTLNIPAPVLALFLQQYEAIFETEPQETPVAPVEVKVTADPLTPEDIRSPRKQHFQEALPTPSFNQDSFPRGTPPSNNTSSHPNKSAYDTGFIPMQPAYENSYGQSGTGQNEYGSMDQKMGGGGGAAYDQFPQPSGVVKQFGGGLSPPPATTKTKRRESSMFGMMGAKKQEDKREQLLSRISSPLAGSVSDVKQT